MSEFYTYYYMNEEKKKDGPHDLVTMMRRIRAGTIKSQTLVFREDEDPTSAHVIEELSHFFNHPSQNLRGDLQEQPKISIIQKLTDGWNFLSENNSLMVLCGAALALSILFGFLINALLGKEIAIALSWILFMLLNSCFFIVAIRMNRGQKIDSDFLEKTLAPILPNLLFLSIVFAFLIPLGMVFLLPAFFASLLFVFASLLILDNKISGFQSIKLAWKLLAKLEGKEKIKLCALSSLYIFSIILIFPIPLMLPIFAGAMCSIYEELIFA